jgi:hypothetical protein
MAATAAGPEFEKAMRPILEAAGPLPHGRLHVSAGASSHSSRRKKPHSRPTSAPVPVAATPFIRRVNGSNWPGHRCARSTVKWTRRRYNLPRPCSGIMPSALVRVGRDSSGLVCANFVWYRVANSPVTWSLR